MDKKKYLKKINGAILEMKTELILPQLQYEQKIWRVDVRLQCCIITHKVVVWRVKKERRGDGTRHGGHRWRSAHKSTVSAERPVRAADSAMGLFPLFEQPEGLAVYGVGRLAAAVTHHGSEQRTGTDKVRTTMA